MTNCSHHHHSEDKADLWTNLATIGGGASGFVSDAYWLGTILDTFSGLAKANSTIIGLSYYAFAFGVTFALLSAGGSAYSHRYLNVFHQNRDHQHTDACCASDLDQMQYCGEAQSAIDTKPLIADAETGLGYDESEDSSDVQTTQKSSLTRYQKLALVGDFISHAGEVAGPLIFVYELATAETSEAPFQKALVLCAATLYGGVSSVAGTRSCMNTMIEHNDAEFRLSHR